LFNHNVCEEKTRGELGISYFVNRTFYGRDRYGTTHQNPLFLKFVRKTIYFSRPTFRINLVTMRKKNIFSLAILLAFCLQTYAQNAIINPKLLAGKWNANWITCPAVSARAYGIYHFRKTIDLSSKPEKFIVHVSADNRYRLFVNGKAICNGPARGDLYNWYFETVDIAPYLQSGKNIIAAQVWNMAEHSAVAQVSNQTAFMLQGDEKAEEIINTSPARWITEPAFIHIWSSAREIMLRQIVIHGVGSRQGMMIISGNLP
jgi:alpha-L-rhamnosidase